MARYDKYDGISGGFRGILAAAITATSGAGSTNQIGIPLAVGVNSSGLVAVGQGATGIIGVLVVDSAKAAGDAVDVMTAGEIVDLDETAYDPGETYYATTAGVISDTNTGRKVGFTVGDKSLTTGTIRSRLIVRPQTPATGAMV